MKNCRQNNEIAQGCHIIQFRLHLLPTHLPWFLNSIVRVTNCPYTHTNAYTFTLGYLVAYRHMQITTYCVRICCFLDISELFNTHTCVHVLPIPITWQRCNQTNSLNNFYCEMTAVAEWLRAWDTLPNVWSYGGRKVLSSNPDRGNIVGWVFHPTRWLVRFPHLNMPFLPNSEFI